MEPKEQYVDETSHLTRPGISGLRQRAWQYGLTDRSDYHGKVLSFLGDSHLYEDDKEGIEKKALVGICAMARKSRSKPMKEIVKRLQNFTRLQIMIFEEDMILNQPVEDWPVVNALISFFSTGFPLDKAIAYKNLHQPFVVNDLDLQKLLQDRSEVYRILRENNIPHPRYTVLNKEKDPSCQVIETDDSIKINGQLHVKPFVEKPLDAEDHNVYLYFPQSAGGGSTRLFRKVKDRSSVYSHISNVRTDGSFLYEDFMQTDGTDVKVYTVGSDYQHAEARKSPCLDGKVERDENGKEVRYPVILSAWEKIISRRVVCAFGQNVCGFDLLRANGKCYVCDVNGFSFVKTSSKYYDDCARILGTMMLRELSPTLHLPIPVSPAPEDVPVVPTTSGEMMELRCVVALFRHGDRTPKQKMKMEVKNKLFFELFERHGGFKKGYLKLKHPTELQEVLDIVRQLLSTDVVCSDPDIQEKRAKLVQMKHVLEMYKFSGINRKIQLKYQPQGLPTRSSSDEFNMQHLLQDDEEAWDSRCRSSVVSPESTEDASKHPSLILILKWGGELTPAGKIQAENLGKAFRTLYPGGQGQYEAPGLGFLRLHSTFRHDLKIYSSDEGRVQMTAAAFTKGLLALEGELTPILVQMVKMSNTTGMLDGGNKSCKTQLAVKDKLQLFFNMDHDFTEMERSMLNPTNTLALNNAMDFVRNPREMCQHVYQMITEITAKIRTLVARLQTRDMRLYNNESCELFIRRWAKLEKDFPLKDGQFKISKIPDIYDCIKYDLQHNMKTLKYDRAHELFMCSKALADIIVPQEYGITVKEKLHIAQNYCTRFLCKIRGDFKQAIELHPEDDATRLDSRKSKGVASPERFVRTRLYFSSESHLHSTLNILRYGQLFEPTSDGQWERALSFLDASAELNYMSHIVFMLFENPSKDLNSDERYHMELHFSPGVYTSCDEPQKPLAMGFRSQHCLRELRYFVTCQKKDETKEDTATVIGKSSSSATSQQLLSAGTTSQDTSDVSGKNTPPTAADHESGPASDAGAEEPPDQNSVKYADNVTGSSAHVDSLKNGQTTTNQGKTQSLRTFLMSPSSTYSGLNRKEPGSISPRYSCPDKAFSSFVSMRSLNYNEQDTHNVTDEHVPCWKNAPTYDRNYKTVPWMLHSSHFPHRSLPCFFTKGLTAGMKGLYRNYTYPLERQRLTHIEPFFNYQALEGFSYVPQLQPLETLHNALTYQKIDNFLDRVTNTHYPIPVVPPPSSDAFIDSKYRLGLPLRASSWHSGTASVPTPISIYAYAPHKDEASADCPSHRDGSDKKATSWNQEQSTFIDEILCHRKDATSPGTVFRSSRKERDESWKPKDPCFRDERVKSKGILS